MVRYFKDYAIIFILAGRILIHNAIANAAFNKKANVNIGFFHIKTVLI